MTDRRARRRRHAFHFHEAAPSGKRGRVRRAHYFRLNLESPQQVGDPIIESRRLRARVSRSNLGVLHPEPRHQELLGRVRGSRHCRLRI